MIMLTFYNVMHGFFLYPWFFDVLQNFVKMGKYLNFFFLVGGVSLYLNFKKFLIA